jgi:transposase
MARHPKKGLKTKARIGFADESAFSDKPMVRRTWAPRGRTPVIKVPSGWSTRSVISMITVSPKGIHPRLYFEVVRRTVNAKRFRTFLTRVKRHMRGGELILIIDNLRVHKSKIVQEYIKSQKSWLAVEYLPPYAPELNPVEYLWSSKKRRHFSNTRINGAYTLDRRIRRSGSTAQKETWLLTGFLKASTLFK